MSSGNGVWNGGGIILTKEGAANLLNYKYVGRDLSLCYKYFLSPLAEACLRFIPHWMAPNLVTLMGLGASVIGYLLLAKYCPDYTSHDAPVWVLPVVGATLFIYQTLDNMDGKHARRTGSGSPLGLLFDHGCDAINVTLGTFVAACIISVGPSPIMLAACFANNSVPFFVATWEEYYTNVLELPIINGPSEGMLMGVFVAVANIWTGPHFWWTKKPALFGLPPAIIMLFINFSGIMLTAVKQISTVATLQRSRGLSVLTPLKDLTGFAAMWILGGIWLSNSPLLLTSINIRALIFLFGSITVDQLSDLMLAHMAHMKYRPLLRPVFLPLLGAAIGVLAGVEAVSTPFFMKCYLSSSLLYVCVKIVILVKEVRDALGVRVFHMTPSGGARKVA